LGLLATVLSAGLLGVVAPSADASGLRDGVCDDGEFCYYYRTDQGGSVSDLRFSMATYRPAEGCYIFKTPGKDGYGSCIANNAASVWNRTGVDVTVYAALNFEEGSVQQVIPAGEKTNLKSGVKNKNKSHRPSLYDSRTTLPNGSCDYGEFCYYYKPSWQGSVADLYIEDVEYAKGTSGGSDDSCVAFLSPGAGQYQCIRNNAASVWNRTNWPIRVYYRANYNGTSYDQIIQPGEKVNLSSKLRNNNASHRPPLEVALTYAACTPEAIPIYGYDADGNPVQIRTEYTVCSLWPF
jgi:hypothetical protein